MEADYTYWEAALIAARIGQKVAMQDGKPQCGFYKHRKIKDGPWIPVSIFIHEDERIIQIDGVPVAIHQHNEIWGKVAHHPVSYEDYSHRTDNGVWPGQTAPEATAEIGDNAAPAAPETPDVILVRELDAAGVWIKATEIDSDELADQAANRVAELLKLKELVVEIHKNEKAPHLEAGRAVDLKYQPLIRDDDNNPGRVKLAVKFLRTKIAQWDAKKKEAARLAAQAIEDARLAELRAMEEKAKASAKDSVATQGGPTTTPAVAPTAPPPPPPPPPPAPVKTSYGGAVGRKISVGPPKKVGVIVDQEACYQHFKANPEVVAVLQKLVNVMVKAKQPVLGVEVRDEEIAL